MHGTTTSPPAHDARPRRGPRWWWVAIVQIVGTYAAFWFALYALFSLPDTGLFGVANDDGTQALGTVAALAAVACLLSGPLFVAFVRRDGRWLWPIAIVGTVLATVLRALLSG